MIIYHCTLCGEELNTEYDERSGTRHMESGEMCWACQSDKAVEDEHDNWAPIREAPDDG